MMMKMIIMILDYNDYNEDDYNVNDHNDGNDDVYEEEEDGNDDDEQAEEDNDNEDEDDHKDNKNFDKEEKDGYVDDNYKENDNDNYKKEATITLITVKYNAHFFTENRVFKDYIKKREREKKKITITKESKTQIPVLIHHQFLRLLAETVLRKKKVHHAQRAEVCERQKQPQPKNEVNAGDEVSPLSLASPLLCKSA